jgi:hypothetical protein
LENIAKTKLLIKDKKFKVVLNKALIYSKKGCRENEKIDRGYRGVG